MDPNGNGSPPPPPPAAAEAIDGAADPFAAAVVPYEPYVGPAAAAAAAPQVELLWAEQYGEAELKNHGLPLARIKRIMKADEDVRMIAAEAPALFARACEMFVLDLTLRAWAHAHDNRRRILQRADVAAAVARTDVFDFLLDVVPRDNETPADADAAAIAAAFADPNADAAAAPPPAADFFGYYHFPQ